jgi:hypothetical protein
MKTIGEILRKNNSALTKLIKKTQGTQSLAFAFQNMLDSNLAKNCSFANLNLEKSMITVTVTNAAWATRLRYAIPDMIKTLRTQPEFKTVTTIRYLINQPTHASKPKKRQKKLSNENEILWQESLIRLKQPRKST